MIRISETYSHPLSIFLLSEEQMAILIEKREHFFQAVSRDKNRSVKIWKRDTYKDCRNRVTWQNEFRWLLDHIAEVTSPSRSVIQHGGYESNQIALQQFRSWWSRWNRFFLQYQVWWNIVYVQYQSYNSINISESDNIKNSFPMQ